MKNIAFALILISLSASAQVVTRTILPSLTDNAIDIFSGPGYEHVVYMDNTVAQKPQLVVFLPGTNGKTGGGKYFNMLAAGLGYKVISLIYPDDFSLSRYARSPEINKYAKGREEIITGRDLVPEINVNRANSIENRLLKLLIYLDNQYPGQGWGGYYNGNTILWNKIIVAGQSQGGGHAAYIAKFHEVARCIMFGSPKDFSLAANRPPDWLAMNSKTPLNRYFSFVHSMDNHNGCTYPQQQMIWKIMGLYTFGAEKDVDKNLPPYGHVHLLTSTKFQDNAHVSVVRDTTYHLAWNYMLTTAEN